MCPVAMEPTGLTHSSLPARRHLAGEPGRDGAGSRESQGIYVEYICAYALGAIVSDPLWPHGL